MTRVRIKDVAEYAGVSTATVSHVINQTRFVSDETRGKVLEAIETLHYQPSAIARGLVTNATQTIGLIVSDITNPFFTAVARGVEDEINRHGYHTILSNTDEDPEREDEYLRLLSARQIDGLIIAPARAHSDRLLQVNESGVPIVLIDRGATGVPAPLVCVDNEGGAYLAVKHLLELGHTRIGILMGMETISTHVMRLSGYKRALTEAGLTIDETLIARTDNWLYLPRASQVSSTPPSSLTNSQMTPATFNALQHLLNLSNRPTAIFITNNQMTLGTLYALKERNLHCPDDISLISFDDPDWAPLFDPPITVVRQPTYHLGQTAARLLMRLIRGEDVEYLSPLPVEFIVRESCRRLEAIPSL
jgi:LacI family transcriptional regulator